MIKKFKNNIPKKTYVLVKEKNIVKPNKKIYTCDCCHVTFHNKSNLNKHNLNKRLVSSGYHRKKS